MNRYILTLFQNTVQNISVRISISYFSLTRKKSPKVWDRLYVHAGPMVVSIALSQEVKLSSTLRDTLIALVVCPITLASLLSVVQDQGSAQDLDMVYSDLISSTSLLSQDLEQSQSIHSLMVSASLSVLGLLSFVRGGRVSIPSFTSPVQTSLCLSMNIIDLCDRYQQRINTSAVSLVEETE